MAKIKLNKNNQIVMVAHSVNTETMAIDIPTYTDPEVLESRLNGYLEDCEAKGNIPNIVGMAHFCGFASRQSLTDYEKKGGRFLHVIKRAKSKCYDVKLQKASKGEMNTTIFIFDAVNNHDMFNTRNENKNDQKHTGAVSLKVTYD